MSTINTKLRIGWVDLGRGVMQVHAWHPDQVEPVGCVWLIGMGPGNAGKSRAEVANSFVRPSYQRIGVRSTINDWIFEEFGLDCITTQNGTEEGGRQFMEKWGYRIHKPTGVWYITRRQWRKRRKELGY